MNRLLARPTRHLLLLACMGAVAGLPVALPGQAVRAGSAAPTGSRLPAPHGAWNVVPSPNTGTPHNYFSGVAAIAANDVWAVGAHGSAPDQAAQLIQHWDGLQWTIADSPVLALPNELLAVSAASAHDVWAVGGYNRGGQALAQHWDGRAWSVVPTPNPGVFNRLFGAAAVSSRNVWAVGQFHDGGLSQTLVERWDGTSWWVVPSPNIPNQHNQLAAVTAVPGSPVELWAVGSAGNTPLILHWNGVQWSIVPTPAAGSNPRLHGVTAVASNDVWAVGYTSGGSGTVSLTLHWDGATWSEIPSPNPSATYNYLWGVTAVGASDIWAVGDFNAEGGRGQVLILHWNGTAWVHVPGENSGPSGLGFTLKAVSAVSATDVWSVGSNSHTLAEHWDGSRWSMAATPNTGIGISVLEGVSGNSADDVWAVGYYGSGIEKRTLIEHWDGTSWRIVPSPNTGKRLNVLNGVAAVSATEAWAVGSASSGHVPDQTTLILRWDGTSWRIVPSPSPGTAGLNELHAVAARPINDVAAADDVWAVGTFTHAGGYIQTLTVHWDGTRWSAIPSANVPGVNNGLLGVAAVGPDDVWAVGYSGVLEFVTLVEHWNGSTWSIVPSPNRSTSSNVLRAASAAPGAVWAVGTAKNLFTSRSGTLAAQWDGSSWSLPVGGAADPSGLYGVAAVSPRDVWLVGDLGGLAMIGRWDGSQWGAFPSPQVPGRLHAACAIDACDVWAVGQRHLPDGGFLTLTQRFTCTSR